MKKLNLILILTFVIQLSWAQQILNINKWNITNPQKITMPAFSDVKNIDGDIFKASQLLKSTQVDINSSKLVWTNIELSDDSIAINQTEKNNLVLLSTYLSVDQWTQGTLNLNINAYCEVFVDNKNVKTKNSADISNTKIKLDLHSGNHEIKIKAITSDKNLKLKASFEYKEEFAACNAQTGLNPERFFTIDDVMNNKNASASISASGKYILFNFTERTGNEGKTKRYSKIYDLSNRENIAVLRNKGISNVNWLPRTDKLTYSIDFEKKSEIFVYDIATSKEKTIAKGIEKLSWFSWSPTEDFVIYSTHIPGEKPGDLKRIFGNDDRLPYFRDRSYLHKIDVKSGKIIQLTSGNYSTSLNDIKADGSKILFSTSRMDYLEVPFSKQNLYEMDVRTLELTTIWEDKIYGGRASYSPDGNKLLVQGGPECFGKIGVNVGNGRYANSYDTQLYIFDLRTKAVDPITKSFDPSVNQAHWSNDNQIYISVTERDYRNLYKYNFRTKKFTKIKLEVEMLGRIDYAYEQAFAIYSGTSISSPNKLYVLDLNKGISSLISFPDKKKYTNIKFGKTEPWNFKNERGTTIYGRVYYPPNYDENKKYPLIVNFYGGTSPVGRSFGGRYPINIWAASNYIVYVLQPSGATGFGQDFSSLHVNGWGYEAIDDIIEGTKKFLLAHSNADAENVGCIGASYGGFTTMLLQTRTNLFKTAISHAGISSITSYWGEGYWGYSYSAGATKNSYPWNNREIYVDRSPIYNANKFQNSILLLHGTSDTNVPVGESLQYYAALKILGKDVEMVLVDGENHWILDYKKRIQWHYTIMSWFDKKLKGQSQQWDNMFPEKNL